MFKICNLNSHFCFSDRKMATAMVEKHHMFCSWWHGLDSEVQPGQIYIVVMPNSVAEVEDTVNVDRCVTM
jgi:hypothetical protein